MAQGSYASGQVVARERAPQAALVEARTRTARTSDDTAPGLGGPQERWQAVLGPSSEGARGRMPSASQVITLQRSVGNIAVSRFLGSLKKKAGSASEGSGDLAKKSPGSIKSPGTGSGGGKAPKGDQEVTATNPVLPETSQVLKEAKETSGDEDYDEAPQLKYMSTAMQSELLNTKGHGPKNPTGAALKLRTFVKAAAVSDTMVVLKQRFGPQEDGTTSPNPTAKQVERYRRVGVQARQRQQGVLDLGPNSPEARSFLSSYTLAGGIPLDEKGKSEVAAAGPRIDVRSTYIGSAPLGIRLRSHLFIVYTSSEGRQTYIRGGPGEPEDGHEDGYTEADAGSYVPGTVDWDPSAPSVTVEKGEKAKSKLEPMLTAARTLTARKVPYVGFTKGLNGENCNATAWSILNQAGVSKRKPSGIHPGWGKELGATKGQAKEPGAAAPDTSGPGEAREVTMNNTQTYADSACAEKAGLLRAGDKVELLFGVGGGISAIRYDGAVAYVATARLQRPREVGVMAYFVNPGNPRGMVDLMDRNGGPTGTFLQEPDRVEVLDTNHKVGDKSEGYMLVRVRAYIGAQESEGYLYGDNISLKPAAKPLPPVPGKNPPPKPHGPKPVLGNQPIVGELPQQKKPAVKGPEPRAPERLEEGEGRKFDAKQLGWTYGLNAKPLGGMIMPGQELEVIEKGFDPSDKAWAGKYVLVLIVGKQLLVPGKTFFSKEELVA